MIQVEELRFDGKSWGHIFRFENAGDILPLHTHKTERENHITVVLYGAFRLLGSRDGEIIEAKAGGTVAQWALDEPHGFVALTDNATMTNLLKHRP